MSLEDIKRMKLVPRYKFGSRIKKFQFGGLPIFSESDTGFANNPEYIEQHTN